MSAAYFEDQLAHHPDELAITDLVRQRSWRELDHNVTALARFFQNNIGLQPGDHIALIIGNRLEYIEAMLAGLLAGLWVTPINTHLTAGEAGYILEDCGARLVLFDEAHQTLLPSIADLQTHNLSALNIETVVNELPTASAQPFAADDAAGGNMLYTSGTTGRPKGVKRAKPDRVDQMIERLRGLGTTFGLTGRGPHLVTGPLYHAAPGMFAIYDLLNGAPMVIMPKWNCDTFFSAVREYRVATTHLVPTMFVRLLEAHEQGATNVDLSSLHYVLHGAAPITKAVKQAMIEWWGPILVEYWGATESGVVTLVTSQEWVDHPGTVGKAIDNFNVFVGDEHGNPTGAAEGLLFCRHKVLERVFSYHQDPQKTRKSHPQPFVFSLGDIGRVENDGFIYLSDRESHMIISGGVNIYPSEVEQALMEHEAVVDAAVFGIPNPEWGEEVKAVVQLRSDIGPDNVSTNDLRDFLRERIAGFKVPRSIQFVELLPRTPTGKVQVHKLKEQYGKPALPNN